MCACKEVGGVSKERVGTKCESAIRAGACWGKRPHKNLHGTPRKHGLQPKMQLHVITKNAKRRPCKRNVKRKTLGPFTFTLQCNNM
jgi:hypothetical protein